MNNTRIITNIDELASLNGNTINQIYCGDCIEVMNKLPSNLVHLIITSSPYNVGIAEV